MSPFDYDFQLAFRNNYASSSIVFKIYWGRQSRKLFIPHLVICRPL